MVSTLCIEIVPLFQELIKDMKATKDANLLTCLLDLFMCCRPIQSYILMICHIFEVLPIASIRMVVDFGNTEALKSNLSLISPIYRQPDIPRLYEPLQKDSRNRFRIQQRHHKPL